MAVIAFIALFLEVKGLLGRPVAGLAPLSFAFAMIWLAFCVYSWVVPPLVRRWINRKWGQ